MSLSMYDASIPVFRRILTNLSNILDKAEAHATAKKIDPSVLLQTRLYPDMLPLVRQVQIASDSVKGGAGNLAGVEIPRFEDVETTIAELKERIAKTLKYVDGISASQIVGTEDKDIELNLGGNKVIFKGQAYLFGFVMANLYFLRDRHAYAILRHCGVEIGKRDFLGAIQ